MAVTACFDGPYAPPPGNTASPAKDAVISTWAGSPAASRAGTNARSPLTTPPTLTAKTRSHSSGGPSHGAPGDGPPTPALRQTRRACGKPAARALIAAGSATSAGTAVAPN